MVPKIVERGAPDRKRRRKRTVDTIVQQLRENAKKATTEDLLDRVTVYRGGMEEEALDVIEQELQSRGVTDEQVRAHAGRLEPVVLWERPGLALRCSFCDRPAVRWGWRWHRLWGRVPIFPRWGRLCAAH